MTRYAAPDTLGGELADGHYQQTKNTLVSYSPNALGCF